jgi:hypothetical protein
MSKGLSHIIIPTTGNTDNPDQNTYQRINDRPTMEHLLHQQFEQHFMQAEGTPFTQETLRNLFGYIGCNQASSLFLDSQNVPHHLPTTTKLVLQQIKRTRPPMDRYFPPEDIRAGFSKWKESTSTSPSGKHLGIYKAINTALKYNLGPFDNDKQKKNLNTNLTYYVMY